MVIGTLIRKMGAAAFYSPEFPRGGLSAVFSGEALGEIGATTLGIELEHRNESDTTWSGAGAIAALTAVGVFSMDMVALKEILRIKYSFTGGSDGDGFRVLLSAPAWRPY
jgi:hypothetical protein